MYLIRYELGIPQTTDDVGSGNIDDCDVQVE